MSITPTPVSYTHLDVYKRQAFTQCNMDNISLSVRPLKNGLFLRIGKYFSKIIPVSYTHLTTS